MTRARAGLVAACASALAPAFAAAAPPPVEAEPTPDLFEVEVYEYETEEQGHVELEQHANATSEHGVHLTWEGVYGVTPWLEAAAYLATRVTPGTHEYVVDEGRLRVRPRTPAHWPLALRWSLNVEAAWDRDGFASLELRPIWTGAFGRVIVGVAPALERERGGSVELQPAGKIAFEATADVALGVEYYGALGRVLAPASGPRQWHELYAAAYVRRWHRVGFEAAVGHGLSGAADALAAKLIVGVAL